MNEIALTGLQLFLLATDAVGIFASIMIAQYYWTENKTSPVYLLYVFFTVLTLVFVALTISDTMVILRAPQSWATMPIVRGLVFRAPLTALELWIISRQHG
jgi:hypothetical protein